MDKKVYERANEIQTEIKTLTELINDEGGGSFVIGVMPDITRIQYEPPTKIQKTLQDILIDRRVDLKREFKEI